MTRMLCARTVLSISLASPVAFAQFAAAGAPGGPAGVPPASAVSGSAAAPAAGTPPATAADGNAPSDPPAADSSAASAGVAPPLNTPPPAPPAEWTWKGMKFSGLFDAYYSGNFNHPASGKNLYHNFDLNANELSLSMAKITIDHAPDPVGFRVDGGYGPAFNFYHSSDTQAPGIFRYLEQAYVTVAPKPAKGLTVDFGEFVTSAGAEVIETYRNWNYSRSLLFALAIPYYHFGLRAQMPVGKLFTGGVQVVNGWNTLGVNNFGRTVGLTSTLGNEKISWSNAVYVGREGTDGLHSARHVFDTVLLLSPNARGSYYINFDYGTDTPTGAATAHWVGIAGAARFPIGKRVAFSPRAEWFNDANGFATGTAQKLKEVTLTWELKIADFMLGRLEYRHDWSDVPVFQRGVTPFAALNQPVLTAGIVAYFGPVR